MSDTAIIVLLAMLTPVLVVGLFANLVLWFGNKPLPYNEEYEREQRRDRKHLARQARLAIKRAA